MVDTELGRQAEKADHSATVETKKKPSIARALYDLFLEKGELCKCTNSGDYRYSLQVLLGVLNAY